MILASRLSSKLKEASVASDNVDLDKVYLRSDVVDQSLGRILPCNLPPSFTLLVKYLYIQGEIDRV